MYASIAWSFCTSHLKCVLRLPLIFIFSCHIFLHLEEEEEDEEKLSKWRQIIKFSSSTKTKHREKIKSQIQIVDKERLLEVVYACILHFRYTLLRIIWTDLFRCDDNLHLSILQ